MTHDTRFDLTISTTDSPNRSASVSSDTVDDVMRLLQLAGQGSTPRRFNATVTRQGDAAGAATMTVSSGEQEDVMRLLQLAGVDSAPDQGCGCDEPCDCAAASEMPSCAGEEPSTMPQPAVVMMEQQAEYDYGHRDPTDEQIEFDLKDYNFKGRADMPERVTNARFGSNALKSEMHESIHARIVKAYKLFINEAEKTIPNEDGRASPLTANNRDEFLKDPFTKEPDTDGSESPLSTIVRQHINR